MKILNVPTKSLRIIYSGRVQGVGFRYTTHNISARYDVSGYVKNLPDGTVEVVVTGPAGEVSDFMAEIAEAMRDQMGRLAYFPQGSTTEPLVRLVEKLAELTPGDLERSWPVTGGSEANETALKIARAYHKRRGESGRYKIISRRGSYHGALGAVMWTGGGAREDYEPAFPGMVYAPQPNPYRCELGGTTPSECAVRCAEAVEELIRFHGASTVAAVIAEPVSSASAEQANPPAAMAPAAARPNRLTASLRVSIRALLA